MKGITREDMATLDASVLLIVLLANICEESFAAGGWTGWTEVRQPDTLQYSSFARFAYFEERPRAVEGLTFLVTQARWRISVGTVYNIGFIVLRNNVMFERCFTIFRVPPIYTLSSQMSVLKFWCTPVV